MKEGKKAIFIYKPLTLWDRIRILFGAKVGCSIWIADGQLYIAAHLEADANKVDLSLPGTTYVVPQNET